MQPETTLQKFSDYQKVFGARGLWLAVQTKLSSGTREVQAMPPGAKHAAFIRLKTSDFQTFHKIFIQREYEISLGKEPKTIVDAGANVGFASIFFALKYPRAKIVAVEPEPSNFAQLQKNVAPYPNITAVQAAVWFEPASLDILDPGLGAWGFQARKNSPGEKHRSLGHVPGMTVPEIMRTHGLEAIDLLKIDIEGGEKELFAANTDWTKRVGAIMIELHDRHRVGCARNFYSATKDFDQELQQGENVILLRAEYVSSAPAKG